jgi:hypothetical protein
MLTSIYGYNVLLYTQICSTGQWMVFSYPILSPQVPTTLMTPYSYPMGHHCYLFVSKNGWKWLKNNFLTMLTSKTSYSTHKYVLSDNEWCSVIIWYYPRYLLHSRPYIVTLWATTATQLRAKMAKKCLKNMFFTMLTFVNFYCTHKYGLWANEGCSVILWYHLRCLLHSWPNIVTP